MKRIALFVAAAALAAPAVFAQTAAVVVEGGPVLLEGAATSKPIRGAVIAEAPVVFAPGTVAVSTSTSVLGAGPAIVSTGPGTVTAVTHYWNMPPDIASRGDFFRWQRLR